MSVTMVDRSGEPPTVEELKEALRAVDRKLTKPDFSDPAFFVMLPTIRRALVLFIRVMESKK